MNKIGKISKQCPMQTERQMRDTPYPFQKSKNQFLLGLKITSTDSLTPFFNWQGSAGQGVIMTSAGDGSLLPKRNDKIINTASSLVIN